MELLRASLNNVTWIEIEGAGHGVTIQRKDEVNRQVAEFLGTQ
jgi:pimeloyl-ACP methyl ester carboxylesterase